MQRQKRQHKVSGKEIKIIIVDDHPIVRRGLTQLVSHEKDLVVCAQAEDAETAMQQVKEFQPEMVIIDISLEKTSGLELIKEINLQYPDIRTLALSMHDEFLYAERALRSGARGYIMKQAATENVVTAIRKILAGEIYVSDRMSEKMMNKLIGGGPEISASVIERLSDRELDVFLLIGGGFSTRQIAEKLELSIKTIETYRAHIKEKLNLADAAELLQYAIQWVNSQKSV